VGLLAGPMTAQATSFQAFANEFVPVSVSGFVYNDLNNSGSQDAGEPGLAGWTVNVEVGNLVARSATTDANGHYTVYDIGPGSFWLVEVLQSGWTQTQPFNPTYYTFTTTSGVNVVGGIFGNHRVPEPGTLALLGIGLAGLGLSRRRKAN